jgi:hypothetical protein
MMMATLVSKAWLEISAFLCCCTSQEIINLKQSTNALLDQEIDF